MEDTSIMSSKKAMEELLQEIDKIKDLNSLAIRYKDVAGTLSIALDSFLSSESQFREEYKTDRESIISDILSFKKSLDAGLGSFSAIDCSLKQQVDIINNKINSLDNLYKQQELSINSVVQALYAECRANQSGISELKDALLQTQNSISEAKQLISNQSETLGSQIETAYHNVSRTEKELLTQLVSVREKNENDNHRILRSIRWALVVLVFLIILNALSLVLPLLS